MLKMRFLIKTLKENLLTIKIKFKKINIKLKQLMCMHYVSDTARYFLIEKGGNVSSTE